MAIALGWAVITPLALSVYPSLAQGGLEAPASPASSDSRIVLIVSPAFGNDDTADGSDRAPFQSITRALQSARAGTTIQLMAGTYSEETGERFPLQLKPGITLQGNPQNRGLEIVIRGSGFFLSPTSARQSVTIVAASQSALSGVTVINPHPQGYGLWIESASPTVTDNTFTVSGHDGISVVGNSAPLIRNNFFYQNGASGITVYGTSRPELRENIFEKNGFAINVNQNAMPFIIGNRITQNKDGVVAQAKSRPILRNNSIEGNERDGLVAIAQAQPDLGTRAEPGGNFIRNNGQFDIQAKTSQGVLAFGNELVKTTGQIYLSGEVASGAEGAGAIAAGSSPESSVQVAQSSTAMPAVAVSASVSPGVSDGQRSPVSAPASNPIAFGQKLTTPPPTRTAPPVSTPPVASVHTPAPGVAPVSAIPRSENQPSAHAAIAMPAVEPAAVPFPVPSALSGQPSDPQPRQMQIVRVSSPETQGSEVKENASQRQGPGSVMGATTAASVPGGVVATKPEVPSPAKSTAPQVRKPVIARTSAPLASRASSPSSPRRATLVTARPSTPAGSSPRLATAPASPGIPPAQPVSAPAPISGQAATASSADATPRSLTFTKPLPPYSSFSQATTLPPSGADTMPAQPVPVSATRTIPPISGRVSQGMPPASAVPIPVPVPEPRPIAPAIAPEPAPAPETLTISSNLLPVPGPNVPIGNVGRRPGVNVYGITNRRDGSSPPVPPNLAGILGVRYRVVVEADNDTQQAQVRTLVPDAFPTSSRGRRVLQAGAFGDREKADQLVQSLMSQGLRAMVETME